MSTSAVRERRPLARSVTFADQMLRVDLVDGRVIEVPLAWFPELLAASESDRASWRLVGGGIGISWDALDEDISVAGLLG